LLELTQVKLTHFTEEQLKEQDEAVLASLPKPKPVPIQVIPVAVERPKAEKLSKEEEQLRDRWERLLEMVSKGRLEPLKSFWEREGANIGGVDARIPDWADEKNMATLLQVAAGSGQEEVTRWLLENCRADPTIPAPSGRFADGDGDNATKTRTAYDFAKTKPIRDLFRRCAAEHPDWWDWFHAGHVPSALSKDMEEERDEKKKVRRKGLKDKIREREAKEKEKPRDATPSPPPELVKPESSNLGGPRKLGGVSGSTDGVAGLTPEMRAKVERERRARAAEARLKAL
jgi:hypothetical protein